MISPEPSRWTLVWIVALLYGVRVTFAVVDTATAPVQFSVVTDVLIPAALAVDLLANPYPHGPPNDLPRSE